MRMHAHAASTAAKMHETRLIRKKAKKNQKTFSLLRRRAPSVRVNILTATDKVFSVAGERPRQGAAANQQPASVAASFAPHNGRRQ